MAEKNGDKRPKKAEQTIEKADKKVKKAQNAALWPEKATKGMKRTEKAQDASLVQIDIFSKVCHHLGLSFYLLSSCYNSRMLSKCAI